ncbi:MAG: glycosyltransferase family 1 protein [Candidatus Uhrbacteria bacterium]|nr:glycosyltransferase family 1 protein [Candidatus Uhrbacteria bacterium]
MTIAIDIRALSQGVGGVAEYTRHIVRTLIETERKHTYILFANSWKGMDSLGFPQTGPRHTTLVCRYPNKLFHASLLLFGRPYLDLLIERKIGIKPDLFFFPNIHFASLSKLTPAILTVHDVSFLLHPELLSFKSYWWHRLIRPKKFIARMQHILAVSNCTKNDCIAICGKSPDDITVTYQDCDSVFRVDSPPVARGTAIVMFGIDELRKNALAALEAFALFVQRDDSARHHTLILVGKNGPLSRQISRRIHELGMSDRVVLSGPLSHDERYKLYSTAGIVLYPSLYEGFGLPLIEAALSGACIISSARASIGEVIQDGALLVDPCNIWGIARALEYALSDDRAGIKKIQNAARQATQRFSWEKTAALTRAAFNTIQSKRSICE